MTRQRPRKPPLVYRLVRDSSAQSETFGVLILLAITVVGTTAIVAFGSQALTETEEASNVQRTGHTMTLLDSRSAMVGLGDSEMQRVDFSSSGDGSFRVDEDAGYIQIKHENFSADESGDELIYNRSLGALIYENGDTTIAYQGGGVWQIQEDGQAQMISQPEFHYRSSTLTLPIIRVRGDGDAAGRTTITVSSKGEPERIYPQPEVGHTAGNETGPPYNGSTGDDLRYVNPVKSGDVNVTIHSEYYKAWAEYFRSRTTADIWVWDSNKTVRVKLEPLGIPEHFGNLNDKVSIRGMPEAHVTSNFTVNMTESKNNQFKHMTWSWYATSGTQKLELYYDSNGNSCSDVQSGSNVLLHIVYKNGTGSHGDETQEWRAEATESDDIIDSVTCPSNDADSIVVNWTAGYRSTSAGDKSFTYEQLPSNEYNCAGGGGSDPSHELGDELSGCSNGEGPGTVVFDQHDADAGPGTCTTSTPCKPGTGVTVNNSFLLNHYLALLGPTYDLQGEEHSNDRLDEDESSGGFYFKQTGARYLQYLHVTENNVEFETE